MDHKPGLLSRKWVRVLLYTASALLLACGVFLLVREHVLLPDPDFVMPETPAPTPVPTAEPLKVGSRGDSVRELQNYLTLMGFSYESADGIYGSRTSDAVNALQVYATLLNAKGTISYTTSNTARPILSCLR